MDSRLNDFNYFSLIQLSCLIVSLAFNLTACSSPNPSPSPLRDTTPFNMQFEYQLSDPILELKLPKELKEISGIELWNDSTLLCVQDELGVFFGVDLRTGEIVQEQVFSVAGDYEGLCLTPQHLVICRSDGRLYFIDKAQIFSQNKPAKALVKETLLDSVNNVEGVCFNPLDGNLLLACKGNPDLKKEGNRKSHKAVYRYSLVEKKLDTVPAILINKKAICNFLAPFTDPKSLMLYEQQQCDKEHLHFHPSDIAVHPITHDVYLLASKGNALLVLGQDTELKAMVPIDPELLPQPEGIAFAPDGTLFIASEGKGKKARVMAFKWAK